MTRQSSGATPILAAVSWKQSGAGLPRSTSSPHFVVCSKQPSRICQPSGLPLQASPLPLARFLVGMQRSVPMVDIHRLGTMRLAYHPKAIRNRPRRLLRDVDCENLERHAPGYALGTARWAVWYVPGRQSRGPVPPCHTSWPRRWPWRCWLQAPWECHGCAGATTAWQPLAAALHPATCTHLLALDRPHRKSAHAGLQACNLHPLMCPFLEMHILGSVPHELTVDQEGL